MPSKTAEKPKKAPAKAAAKPAAKTAAAKPAAKTNALQQPMTPSAELSAVVGAGPIPRAQVVSKVWEYIKSKNLQNPANKREILADDKLKKVFGKDKVTMFEMNKHLAAHLK
jgi:chromatin remodeling complex protein RSC6